MTDEPNNASTGSEARKELGSKIGFLLLDKVVFGLLIVLAGFVLNSILESNRAETAFENEIAKVRVEKVAAAWAVLDTQQLLTEDLARVFSQRECTGRGLSKFVQIQEALRRGNVRFERLLAANRFWLGDELYAELRSYAQSQSHLMTFLSQKQKQRQAVARSVLALSAMMEKERTGAGKLPRLPPLPATPRELAVLKRMVKSAKLPKQKALLEELLCTPALTKAERGLFGQIKGGLEEGRQDVAGVTERFVS